MSELTVGSISGLAVNNNVVSIPSGHKLHAPGSVVQVITAQTGFIAQTINSTAPQPVTNMSVTITPKFSNSKFLIEAAISSSWTYVAGLHIYKNGSDIIATSHGGNTQTGGGTSIWTKYFSGVSPDTTPDSMMTFPVLYFDTPATLSPITYDIRVNSGWNGGSNAIYINNRPGGDMLSSSYMMVTEIAQ
jgi:hypothetical protein